MNNKKVTLKKVRKSRKLVANSLTIGNPSRESVSKDWKQRHGDTRVRMVQPAIDTNITLDQIHQLLNKGHAADALAVINQNEDQSDLWQNARGVCLLRLGLYERAVEVYRRIVFPGNTICVPEGVPALYRANLATALLLTHCMDGAINLIEHLEDDGHPYVKALRQAAQKWKQNMRLLQKIGLWMGWYPKQPLQFDFLPGSL